MNVEQRIIELENQLEIAQQEIDELKKNSHPPINIDELITQALVQHGLIQKKQYWGDDY